MSDKEYMTVSEAAKRLGIGEQALRWGMQQGQIPIGLCIQTKSRRRYIVLTKWLERWLNGDPVQIPEGRSSKKEEE